MGDCTEHMPGLMGATATQSSLTIALWEGRPIVAKHSDFSRKTGNPNKYEASSFFKIKTSSSIAFKTPDGQPPSNMLVGETLTSIIKFIQ